MDKRKIINIAFLCSILILIAISIAAYMNLIALQENAEQVKRSYVSINLLSKIEKTIIDGETGQRGYIITRNTSYLEPYFGSKNEINYLVEQYKSHKAGNPQRLKDFNLLETMITKKFSEMNFVIILK